MNWESGTLQRGVSEQKRMACVRLRDRATRHDENLRPDQLTTENDG